MLEPLFGSINRERILLFLLANKEGYADTISAQTWKRGVLTVTSQSSLALKKRFQW